MCQGGGTHGAPPTCSDEEREDGEGIVGGVTGGGDWKGVTGGGSEQNVK